MSQPPPSRSSLPSASTFLPSSCQSNEWELPRRFGTAYRTLCFCTGPSSVAVDAACRFTHMIEAENNAETDLASLLRRSLTTPAFLSEGVLLQLAAFSFFVGTSTDPFVVGLIVAAAIFHLPWRVTAPLVSIGRRAMRRGVHVMTLLYICRSVLSCARSSTLSVRVTARR